MLIPCEHLGMGRGPTHAEEITYNHRGQTLEINSVQQRHPYRGES